MTKPLTMNKLEEFARKQCSNWKAVIFKDPCCYCMRPSDTREHVIPRSAGGRGLLLNTVGACAECNRKRGNIPFFRYFLKYGGQTHLIRRIV